ncbi:S8 family serine peptidase [Pseudomonas sp. S31]|nr:S8 family serine peptidase [Pseudomonas sp. S31]
MSGLIEEDVKHAREIFQGKGVRAMYDYLAGKGDRYAVLANGVARGNSIAGIAAIDFMKRTEAAAGRPMQEADIEKVRVEMAKAYLGLLDDKVRKGEIGNDINHVEVWGFHTKVFEDLGRSKDAWTLNTVFELRHPDHREDYWRTVLEAAGSTSAEFWLSFQTDSAVAYSTVVAPEALQSMAKSWKARIDSPEGIGSFVVALGKVSANGIQGVVSDLITADDPAPAATLKIEITPTTESRRDLQGQDDLRNDVSAGFVKRRLTHSIAFTDNTLNNTDFTSAQLGSLASGGIRPGELQADPNVRPNQHLSQFYREDATKPDFSLRNAAVLNGLAAMTTVNTFVDPLLFDLGGQGVGMTGMEDAVLFDVDNSGQLRRTGWADRNTGMLVHDDGSGQVSSVRQLFSEYYQGQPGSNGAPGEAPFADGFAALRSVDANADGAITPADPIWAQLKLWIDANHDGRAEGAELKPLAELGVSLIGVGQVQSVGEVRQGNEVISRGTFLIDGAQREVLAVRFLADSVGNLADVQPHATLLTSTSGDISRRAYLSTRAEGSELDAALLGVDTLQGGAGDDVLKAAPGGSWLVGGGGSNTYEGGPGDDVLVISARDQQANIRGNGGRDTALIVGEQGVGLNLAEAGLTIAQGGRGKDVIISGGQRGVFIKGGSGDSLLIGGAGNDVLVGGTGRNTILGGTGKAVIYAGPSGDHIQASAAGSIIHAGGGADRIIGGAADDVIEAGRGNAVIDGAGGVNVVSLHGNHDEYLITRTVTGYQVSDRQTGRDGTLTLSNVQKLSFADIAAIDLQGAAAMPIGDTLAPTQAAAFATSAGTLIVPAAVLLANDLPLSGVGPLRIASVSDGKGAAVSLNAQGDVEVRADPGHDSDITFRYDLVDAAGQASLNVTETTSGASAPLRATVTLRHDQSPADPLAARQWYLREIDVQPVWRDFTGKGVRIGQFEPGGDFAVAPEVFDIQHPDLKANVDDIWLSTQRRNGSLPALASNHATQVAGVMVGARNDQGGIGIAYDAKIGGHYLANKGDDLTSLGQMVNYDVVNHSWGFKTDFAIGNVPEGKIDTSLALAFSATLAATNGRGGLGTIVVAAGGNQRERGGSAQGSLINNSRYAIEVAAVNAKADLSVLQVTSAPFSNPGASLLVAAPGSHVLSTGVSLEAERGSMVGSAYGTTQGTSFAAPIVSGVAALMLQANPGLGYRDVQQILALSARKVDDGNSAWAYNAGSNWNGGGMRASHDYGFGMIDARAAVRLAQSWPGQATKANERQLAAASESLAQVIAPGKVGTFSLSMPAGVLVEHVEVDIHSQVGRLGDMTLTLISPGGARSVLLQRSGKAPGSADDDVGSLRSGVFKYAFMSTHHRAEGSAGDWRLEVSNAIGGLPMTLDRWDLRVVGSQVTADDVYFYTDEYPMALSQEPARGALDDAVNGTAGGRNTLNAAALRGRVSIDLAAGTATIAGAALTLAPGAVHNLISGDGDDMLIAGAQGAWLDGGRGSNRLRGGSATDRYVIHRRAGGSDVVEQFELEREVVDLIGFAERTFTDLQIKQEGNAALVDLGAGQTLRLADRSAAQLQPSHFRFLEGPMAAPGYFDGSQDKPPQAPTSGTVLLEGGAQGVSLSSDASGQFVAALTGTIYSPPSVAPSIFVVAKQDDVSDYRNAVRGFRHGIDKIDLSQTGITRFEDLRLSKDERFQLNGFAQIHGVTVSGQASDLKLLYLDALELAQVTSEDFIFASPVPPAMSAATLPPLPNLANLLDAMAAFNPQTADSLPLGTAPTQPWDSTLAVAA